MYKIVKLITDSIQPWFYNTAMAIWFPVVKMHSYSSNGVLVADCQVFL